MISVSGHINIDIDEIERKISAEISRKFVASVRRVFTRVINTSPVVTGAYLAGHELSFGTGFKSEAEVPEGASGLRAGQMSKLGQFLLELDAQILLKKPDDSITVFISNPVAHAAKVEWIGWPEFGKAPRAVYQLAVMAEKDF